MITVTHEEYRCRPGINWSEVDDDNQDYGLESFEVVDALIDIKYVDDGARLVALLNNSNELSIWKEEYVRGLFGSFWGCYDNMCGFVDHDEMVALYTDKEQASA